jgi:membrane protein
MISSFLSVLREAARQWSAHKAPKMGAALSYYTALSLAPLVLLVLSVVSLAVSSETAQAELVAQFNELVGPEGGALVKGILKNAAEGGGGVWATIVGFTVLLLGASAVFGELQDSLNQIWDVPPSRRPWTEKLKDRALSFAMVFVIGFLLLVSLILSAAISGITKFMSGALPALGMVWELGNTSVSFVVATLLFAIIFRVLPDVRIEWRDVWTGAAITALLFVVGKFLLGLYLGRSAVGSSYGAAGSLIVILLWVYYSSQILFFGAEFTCAYAKQRAARSRGGGRFPTTI